jgi:hypothetical protein
MKHRKKYFKHCYLTYLRSDGASVMTAGSRTVDSSNTTACYMLKFHSIESVATVQCGFQRKFHDIPPLATSV